MTYWIYIKNKNYAAVQKQQMLKLIPIDERPLKWGQNLSINPDISNSPVHVQPTILVKFNTSMNSIMTEIQSNDILICLKLSDLSHSWNKLKRLINKLQRNHIQLYVVQGHWTLNNTNNLDNQKLLSLYQFQQDINIYKMNHARKKLTLKHGKYWRTGNMPRFMGPKRNYYIKVFQYAGQYSEQQTAKKFKISTRTVARIKRDGEAYFNLPKRNRIK